MLKALNEVALAALVVALVLGGCLGAFGVMSALGVQSSPRLELVLAVIAFLGGAWRGLRRADVLPAVVGVALPLIALSVISGIVVNKIPDVEHRPILDLATLILAILWLSLAALGVWSGRIVKGKMANRLVTRPNRGATH